MKGLVFLDIDGCMNHQLFYNTQPFPMDTVKGSKKQLKKDVKSGRIERLDYYKSQICPETIKLFSNMVNELDLGVVISSTWRMGKTIEELQEIFDYSGGTFKVLDKTGMCECRNRGCEIKKWLEDNCMKLFGVHSFDFKRFIILDDDCDMLLEQANHFFWCDPYSGFTPTMAHRINMFFGAGTFNFLKNVN